MDTKLTDVKNTPEFKYVSKKYKNLNETEQLEKAEKLITIGKSSTAQESKDYQRFLASKKPFYKKSPLQIVATAIVSGTAGYVIGNVIQKKRNSSEKQPKK